MCCVLSKINLIWWQWNLADESGARGNNCMNMIMRIFWIYFEHTHTTVLRLCGICPGQPGWAGTRRNIHPLHSSWSSWIYFERKKKRILQRLEPFSLVAMKSRPEWFWNIDCKDNTGWIRHCTAMEIEWISHGDVRVGMMLKGYEKFWSVPRRCTGSKQLEEKNEWATG